MESISPDSKFKDIRIPKVSDPLPETEAKYKAEIILHLRMQTRLLLLISGANQQIIQLPERR